MSQAIKKKDYIIIILDLKDKTYVSICLPLPALTHTFITFISLK